MNKPTYILRSREAEEARKAELEALRCKDKEQQMIIQDIQERREMDALNRKTQSRRDVESGVATALRYQEQAEAQKIKARQCMIVLASMLISGVIILWMLCQSGLLDCGAARLSAELLITAAAWKAGTLWGPAWND